MCVAEITRHSVICVAGSARHGVMCVAESARHGVMRVAEITRYGVMCVAEIAYGRQNKRARSVARIHNLKCDTKPRGAKVRLETKLRGAKCSEDIQPEVRHKATRREGTAGNQATRRDVLLEIKLRAKKMRLKTEGWIGSAENGVKMV